MTNTTRDLSQVAVDSDDTQTKPHENQTYLFSTCQTVDQVCPG